MFILFILNGVIGELEISIRLSAYLIGQSADLSNDTIKVDSIINCSLLVESC